MNKMIYNVRNREETIAVGEKIGRGLSAGDIVCITGDLGAGKTVIASGIAKGLGVKETEYITSPTFTIVNEYSGTIPFFHFDVYRVHDPEGLYEIGFDEYFTAGGVVCIEWANLIYDLIPGKYININLSKINKADCENAREIIITGDICL